MGLDLKDFVFHKIKIKEAQEKQRLWKLRIKKAKEGILFFSKKNVHGAITAYVAYFDALKIGKKIDTEAEVTAAHFDKQKEGGEMLLISFISMDMMKIYDKLKVRPAIGSTLTPEKAQLEELRKAKRCFISFTKGMKYQPLLAEQLRKFIRDNKSKLAHKSEFEDTYEQVRVKLGKCFIAHALYPQEAEEIIILRNFRDSFLLNFYLGRVFVNIYYSISPFIAIYFDESLAPISRLGRTFKMLTQKLITQISKFLKPYFY